MAVSIAEAFILVRPDLSGFRSTLQTGIKKEIDALKAKPPTIPIKVTLAKGELTRIKKEIDALTGVTVPVTPVLAGDALVRLREELTALSKQEVLVHVTVDPAALRTAQTRIDALTGRSVSIFPTVPTDAIARIQEQINAIVGGTVTVEARLDPAAVTALREQLAAITGGVLNVEARIDPASLAALREQLAAVTGGVVNVEVRLSPDSLAAIRTQLNAVEADLPVTAKLTAESKRKIKSDIAAIKAEVPVTAKLARDAKTKLTDELRRAGAVPFEATPTATAAEPVPVAAPEVTGTARVPVTPDTRGFQTALQNQVKEAAAKVKASVSVALRIATGEAEKLRKAVGAIGGATVNVTPVVPPAAIATVREQLAGLTGVQVPVTPVVSGAAAREAATAATPGGAARVPVTPDFRGFTAALRDGVRAAAERVTARVSVGFKIATGAREQLRKEIAAIPSATVPVRLDVQGDEEVRRAVEAIPTLPETRSPEQVEADRRQLERIRKSAQERADREVKKSKEPPAAPTPQTDLPQTKAFQRELLKLEQLELRVRDAQKLLANETARVEDVTQAAGGAARLAESADAARAAIARQLVGVEGELADAIRKRAVATAEAAKQTATDLRTRARGIGATTATGQVRAVTGPVAESIASSKAAVAAISAEIEAAQRSIADGAQEAAKSTFTAERAQEQLKKAIQDVGVAERATRAARRTTDRELIAETEAIENSARSARDELRSTERVAKDVARQIAIARDIANVPQAGLAADTPLQRAQARETAAARALRAARKELETQTKANNLIGKQSAAILERDALAALRDAKAQREDAAAAELRSRRTVQAARGAAASALSFVGLRAQVLAASGAFIAGTVAVTSLAKAFSSFANLEEELNVFQVTTGATAEQMERVGAVARELGADITLPGVSAGDAAAAMSELARAGLTVNQSLAATRGVLQLATAAQIDNAQAAELVAGALNAFGLAGDRAIHVADLLANAANQAQGSISDFGAALQQVSAVAAQTGVSLDNTTALLTLLARSGLRGSDAGTSLRTALLRLAAPTQQARDLLASLNIETRDLQGNIRPEVFADFAEATAGMATSVRDAIAAEIFGQDAIRAALLAGRQGASGLHQVQRALERQGAAADLAAARTKGLRGEIGALGSNIETLGGQLGQKLAGPAEVLVGGLNALVGGLSDLVDTSNRFEANAAEMRQSFLEDIASPSSVARDRAKGLREELENFSKFPGGPSAETIDAIINPTKLAADQLADAEENLRRFQNRIATNQRGGFLDFLAVDLPFGLSKTRGSFEALRAAVETARANLEGKLNPALRSTSTAFIDASDRGQALTQTIDGLADAAARSSFQAELVARAQQLGEEIRAQMRLLSDPTATGEAIDAARQKIDTGLAELFNDLGSAGIRVAQQLGPLVAPILGTTVADMVEEFSGVGDLIQKKVPPKLELAITTLAKFPAGRRLLRQMGNRLAEELAEGISERSDAAADAVKDAQQALADAIAEGADRVRASVDQARGNFESFGDSLIRGVEELIDAGPIQQQIDKINKELDAFEERTSRRQLRFNLSQAKEDLEDMRKTLVTIGAPNEAQRQQIAKVLAPLREDVAKANDEITRFNLNDTKDDLEDAKEKAKKAAREGIEALIRSFEEGRISASKFESLLRDKLQPSLDTLRKNRKNLGLSFERGFMRDLNDLVKQAQFLVGFLSTPETSRVVNPREAQRERDSRVAEARDRLAEAINAQKKTEEHARNLKPIRDTLVLINKALRSTPTSGSTKAPKPSARDRNQQNDRAHNTTP